jgi:preprotein translocase subunit SecA
VPLEQWKPVYDSFVEQCRAEHDEVIAMGGLHILGTERHEARRIDNQLRGRAGRQGDPGASRFFLSLEDDLMRIFGGEKVKNLMYMLGMTEGVPIESRLISKRIETAQKNVEAQHFEARKHLLEYDDVMNKQREAIYGLRRSFLEGRDQKEFVLERAEMIADSLVETYCPREQHPEQWNVTQFNNEVLNQYGIDLKVAGVDPVNMSHDDLQNTFVDKVKERYEQKETMFGAPTLRWLERHILLDIVDAQWKDHLLTLDHLKEGIGLRGYGQKDPLVEYKRESFDMFEAMMQRFQEDTTRYLYLMQIIERGSGGGVGPGPGESDQSQSAPAGLPSGNDGNGHRPPRNVSTSMDDLEESFQRRKRRELEQARMAGAGERQPVQQVIRGSAKVGRNDPCPCGSGKKYKKCCGANA